MSTITNTINNAIDTVKAAVTSNGTDNTANGTASNGSTNPRPAVLILGSGLVSPPIIHYLTQHNIYVIVASRTVSKAEATLKGITNAKAVAFDVDEPNAIETKLDALVQNVDCVVSLLPYIYHVRAAQIALKYKKHFCTTSYIAPEMQALDAQFKANNTICLNECGVDPGLDHMSAQRVIDQIHGQGGKVTYFTSVCGGLPAPKANTNPLGYKLSWAPRGVLLASRNPAIVLKDGQRIEYGPGKIYEEGNYIKEDVVEGQELEWYYNRDSTAYISIYGIEETLTCIRGTYRFRGWARFLKALSNVGLTSTDALESQYKGVTYAEFIAGYVGGDKSGDAKQLTAAKIGVDVNDDIIKRFEYLGLFSSEYKVNAATPLDVVCWQFERTCQYADNEQDQIVMKHTFEASYPDGRRETITSTLIDIGKQPSGFSSMARTVSLPLAVAIRAMLEKRIQLPEVVGVVRPIKPALYNLILDEMETLGVKFTDTTLPQTLWIRHEVKEGEERVITVPNDAKKLIDAGFVVNVERSSTRCIPDAEYERVGCHLVPTESWTEAPHSAIIMGLKELPEADTPLRHRHIQFAHCYKNQGGWKDVLSRFPRGGGTLYDIEFLEDENKRRVAAFGRAAGLVGMALALKQWAMQRLGTKMSAPLKSWPSLDAAVKDVSSDIDRALQHIKSTERPTAMVLGALGRCGNGAVWFAEQCNVATTKWDIQETKRGGPFPELLQYDVLVNAIYLSSKIEPFVNNEMIKAGDRKLSVISDVSCDTSNPFNPLPIYNQLTTLRQPVLNILPSSGQTPALDMIAIDHLPSLIPTDASTQFSADLTPHLLRLQNPHADSVWQRAYQLYLTKVQTLPADLQKPAAVKN